MVKRTSWLSITPEPERELPWAVATLAQARPAGPEAVERERARIEGLLLRGGQRRWLAYLRGAIALIESAGAAGAVRDPEVARARALAADVISNHHALLLGLPGGAARRTAADRATLASVMTSITRQERDLNEHDRVTANGRV